MNRKFLVAIALAAVLMLTVGQLAAVADDPNPFEMAKVQYPIHLNLTYCWSGYSCGTSVLTANADHTFTSSSGAYGTWTYASKTKAVQFQYLTGCSPLYKGTYQGHGYGSGTMACTVGSGSGTWSAQYAKVVAPVTGASSWDDSPR